jgi:excisionase family DNA binding protein
MSISGEDHNQQIKLSLVENVLTVREVAAYLRVTVTTVCNLDSSEELPGFRIGKSWRFAG